MEQSTLSNEFVLITCTLIYRKKSIERNRGLGYEGYTISSELLTKGNERKFTLVIRKCGISDYFLIFSE